MSSVYNDNLENNSQRDINTLSSNIKKLREKRLSRVLSVNIKERFYFKCMVKGKLCFCRDRIVTMENENEFLKHKISGGLDFDFFYNSDPNPSEISYYTSVFKNEDKHELINFDSEKEAQSYLRLIAFR